ncbi:formate dehydrogenase accessory sulfurtransferase FdhD [Jatrophihabitans telluris]|uniref:Sulfur carrier protein FdhD n=1 Tax=Jatrophihabitans telluris TaxID=2038343 RepID=A0ABY4QSF9_9ACTN|nr:formate dehydrogenase accessory sulfurtransferase FdhD [Jatrophihabitans telluris]UQX86793.1 formate dehydrogenase accessory sulfurtransferase FdhD [Jatrophihabitans telluris]
MSTRRRVIRLAFADDGTLRESDGRGDDLSAEAPLNLVVDGTVIATLMRTPGHDVELAAGWLVVESSLHRPDQLLQLRQCRTEDDLDARAEDAGGRGVDQVHLTLAPDVTPPQPRAWVTGTSCGVCSADVLDLAPLRWAPASTSGWRVSPEVLQELPDRVRTQQKTFQRTGSLHAAALATNRGELLVVREDVGRHNAVDKVHGWALLDSRLPATDLLLVVSGRVSFEIVQKAVASAVAGIVAVSAPSDLAVDLAREHGLLLAGMVRPGRLNLYSGEDRVVGL